MESAIELVTLAADFVDDAGELAAKIKRVVAPHLERNRLVREIDALIRRQPMGNEIAGELQRLKVIERFVQVGRPLEELYWVLKMRWGVEIAEGVHVALVADLDVLYRPVQPVALIAARMLPGLSFKPIEISDRERIRESKAFDATTGPPR
jgi:hypothetical protein